MGGTSTKKVYLCCGKHRRTIMAYNASDLAKKIVCRTDVEHGDTISNLKLQKLLYYMQGFHLALFDAPFFNETIEAWTYGPVVPVVFREFKRYQNRSINPENYHDELQLPDEEERMFNRVYDEYSRFSAVALMQMTHNEGPWRSHDIGDVITNDELRRFFLTQIDRDNEFLTDENGHIMLSDNMRQAVHTAEKSLADGACLTEEMFQTRFAKWI